MIAELGLHLETPPAWAERALAEPLELLSDHAHCELRAAAAAQGLVTRNPLSAQLVDRLSALAIEEMRHFKSVVALLRILGGELKPAFANPYVEALQQRSKESRSSALLDRLLVAGLIEARSCERFALLSEAPGDPRARSLYAELLASEAGHANLFRGLAAEAFGRERVRARYEELGVLEAEVVAALPFAPRVHSGWNEPAA